MIEARIVEASDTFGRSLGVRLGGTDLRANRGGMVATTSVAEIEWLLAPVIAMQ